MAIRNAAKAIVVHNDKVLINKCISEHNEIYYDLPGGGQLQFETMEDAVIREVLEETGYKVRIVRFAALAEEICDSVEFQNKAIEYSHRVLHIFIAELTDEQPVTPTEKDHQQDESVWMSFDSADNVVFRPQNLSNKITSLIKNSHPQYLGCVRIL